MDDRTWSLKEKRMNPKLLFQIAGLRKTEERVDLVGLYKSSTLDTLSFRSLSKWKFQKRSGICNLTLRREARLEI